jgi:glycine cleavage system regulatory protein
MTANETTDHAWVREQVATYLAGGLADDERSRFEAHVGACGSCLEDLQDAQGTERSLAALFEEDRPDPGLEDRVIQSLRAIPAPRFRIPPAAVRVLSGIAAVLLLGVAGYFFEASVIPKAPTPSGSVVSFAYGNPASIEGHSAPNDEKARISETDFIDHNESAGAEFERRASSRDLATRKSGELLARLKDKESLGSDIEKRRFADEKADFRQTLPAPTPGSAEVEAKNADSWKGEDTLQGDWFKPGSEAEAGKTVNKIGPGQPATKKLDQEAVPVKNPPPAQDPQASQRKIIRQGELEFEVDSFDSSVDKVARIAAEEKGFVATVNSDRLPNGKVKGSIVLRVPPESLDRLVLKLRALGELKSQRITSEDITKKYYDLESRLKAARTMETRLIEIIKTGKGEIKDILAAEKELGEWREKIEIFEGEIRFYTNLVSLSTLTLTLLEKDIRAPSLVTVTETVDTGIEAEDVLKADKELRALIADAKGRITTSDLKKLAADQFSLLITCEVPPDNAGTLRDRLNQIGRVARLDVQTATSDNGTGRPLDGKVKRADTVFKISVYNTANVQPRETSLLSLACPDVEAVFRAILARVGQAGGRVVQSNLNRVKADQVDGVVQFEVPARDGQAVLGDLRVLGEVMSFKVMENPDSANVTKSKKGFHVSLLAMAHVTARETTTLRLAAKDVAATYRALQAFALEKKGRILDARLTEETRDAVSAHLDLEIPRADRAAFDEALKGAGEILAQNVQRAQDDGRVVDSKIRLVLSLQTVASVGPRRIVKLGVEVSDVDRASERITKAVADGGGQLVDSQNSRDPSGRAVSYLVFEARLDAMAAMVDVIRKSGTVRVEETRRNPSAPESDLAIGRIELTLSNEDPIVGSDSGFGAQMKDALRTVIAAAGFSLKFIVIGALIVVPWALIAWFAWKLVRRKRAAV